MAEIIAVPGDNAAVKGAIKEALGGRRQRHRLCFDFNTIEGLKDFFVRVKQAGITHPGSVPVLMHQDGDQTVWLVGFKKESPTLESLDV